jgi:hypothetical protein
MLAAAAAWLLLRRRRWSRFRVLLVVAGALVAALIIAFGVGLASGQVSHGSRIARELLGSDPSAAARAVRHQLSGNFGLLSENFWAWWGPLLVAFAALASVRPPRLLAGVPAHVRRAVGVGAIGSVLLIVLNDTGVTASAGSGLALLVTLLWCALEPSPPQPAATAAKVAERPAPAEQPAADDSRKPDRVTAAAEPTPAWEQPLPDWGDLAPDRGGDAG